jgi:hypothetical protein
LLETLAGVSKVISSDVALADACTVLQEYVRLKDGVAQLNVKEQRLSNLLQVRHRRSFRICAQLMHASRAVLFLAYLPRLCNIESTLRACLISRVLVLLAPKPTD